MLNLICRKSAMLLVVTACTLATVTTTVSAANAPRVLKQFTTLPVPSKGQVRSAALPSAATAIATPPLVSAGQYDPTAVMVHFQAAASATDIADLLQKHGLTMAPKFASSSARKLKISGRSDVLEVIKKLQQEGIVKLVEPNFRVSIHQNLPNDPLFDQLWGLNNTGTQGVGAKMDADIDAPEAWNTVVGSKEVYVAVLDTGIDITHRDLQANLWRNPAELAGRPGIDDDGNGYIDDIYGWNCISDNGFPVDDNGHGTHVAGTIGATTNNSLGVSGVCWDVNLVAVKIFDSNGMGYVDDVLEGIDYLLSLKAGGVNIRVANNSWGFDDAYSHALYEAIEQLATANILFVSSAGNSATNNDNFQSTPSTFDLENIISVAALDSDDTLIYFSSYGATSVDVAAPGVYILSTVAEIADQDEATAPTEFFFDDLEGDTSLWQPIAPWAVVQDEEDAHNHYWSDSPHGNYLDDQNLKLTSPLIDLSAATKSLVLGFQAKLYLEFSYDYLLVEASADDGLTWTQIGRLTGYQSWGYQRVIVPHFFCSDQFRFRFRLESDEFINYDGVLIDDIGIGYQDSNAYAKYSGTSMAAPHVSGLAALLLAQDQNLSATKLKNIIINTSVPVPDLTDLVLSNGRINANAAQDEMAALTPKAYRVSPQRGPEGATIKIYGSELGAELGRVQFLPDIQAPISAWTANEITLQVPAGAQTGPIYLYHNDGRQLAIVPSYTVLDLQIQTENSMPTPAYRLTSTYYDGKIYCIGGGSSSSSLSQVQIFDPQLNWWRMGALKPTAVEAAAASLLDGRIYLTGGIKLYYFWALPQAAVEIYDPVADSWEPGSDLPKALYGHQTVAVGRNLFLFGGFGYDGPNQDIYILQGNTWNVIAKWDSPTVFSKAIASGGKVYIFGGVDSESNELLDKLQIFDISTNSWSVGPTLPTPLYDFALAHHEDSVYLVGGNRRSYWNAPYSDQVYRFDLRDLSWSTEPYYLAIPRQSFTAAISESNGRLYLLGGYAEGNMLSINESLPLKATAQSKLAIHTLTSSVPNLGSPLSILFGAIAGGGSGSYQFSWDFGDGYHDEGPAPRHAYAAAGEYLVQVVVTDTISELAARKTFLQAVGAEVNTPLVLNKLTADIAQGRLPLEVVFAVECQGGNQDYQYVWDFGDGGSSTQQNPTHTYVEAGRYPVAVTITDTSTAQNYTGGQLSITAHPAYQEYLPLGIDLLTADLVQGYSPLLVAYTLEPVGGSGNYSYSWVFGDGMASAAQSPSYVFDKPGKYLTTVTVTDVEDSALSVEASLQITVLAANTVLDIDITAAPSAADYRSIAFTAKIAGGTAPYYLHWNFGDGQTVDKISSGSINTAVHAYERDGKFQVMLDVTTESGASSSRIINIGNLLVDVAVPVKASPESGGGKGLCFIAEAGSVRSNNWVEAITAQVAAVCRALMGAVAK